MPTLLLRAAELRDCELVHSWRNDPFIIARGSSNRPVSEAEHVKWFSESIRDPAHRLQIVEIEGKEAGLVRFCRHDDKRCVISIYLTKPFVGRGFGSVVIREATDGVIRDWNVAVIACVREDNVAGGHAFRRAGYILESGHSMCPQGHRTYIKENSGVR
jgi:RimJ/RimL family protein N-acetyltransferase